MVPETHPVCRCDGSIARGALWLRALFPGKNCWRTRIRSRRETGCRRFRCAALPTPRRQRGNGVPPFLGEGRADHRHHSAVLQARVLRALLPHRPAGRVRGLLPRDAREHARGHRALPRMLAARHRCACPPSRRPPRACASPQQIEHILHGLVQVYEHDVRISADLPDGFDAESVCRFVIENVMGSLHHQNGNCDVLFGLLERTLYANRTQ